MKDGKDEDLTAEPEMIKAFRDTWELGIHSYLTYMRDRLLLARDLLSESGSIFVQISDENVHHVRELMDEVFGVKNFISIISFSTTSGFETTRLARAGDYLVWYAKEISKVKFRSLFVEKDISIEGGKYRWIIEKNQSRALTANEIRGEVSPPDNVRFYQPTSLVSQGGGSYSVFEYHGHTYTINQGSHWKTKLDGMQRIAKTNRIHIAKNSIRYVRFAEDFPLKSIRNIWTDTATGNFTDDKIYVVQTGYKVLTRCILMTTDPGDLVLDPTCGSGTTAYVAEQWGRRWITCDTSRIAVTLAKQRLMTAAYDYYELAHPAEGVGSGFRYKTVPHITLKSIANNEDIDKIYDRYHPAIEKALNDLNKILSQKWLEWDVNHVADPEWKKAGLKAWEAFWEAKSKMQQHMDASIKRHAPQETLYDQPYVDRSKARVSGPFTIEAVPAL